MTTPELQRAATALRDGNVPVVVTVRDLLSWFGYKRRAALVVAEIRSALAQEGIVTEPDFSSVGIDASVQLKAAPAGSTEKSSSAAAPTATDTPDPVYRIGFLDSANAGITPIEPSASLAQAITLMLSRDFSQLPVMQGTRNVPGFISWKSIGSKLALGGIPAAVRDCIQGARVVSYDAALFSTIEEIVQHEFVLVRDSRGEISGIVTTTDLSSQFRVLTEPFLLLSEIENQVRSLIVHRAKIPNSKICELCNLDPTKYGGVAELSFGDYVRILENPDCWSLTNLALDRSVFRSHLDDVRLIRNEVMHFDPDPIEKEELVRLRKFANFMQTISEIAP